MQLALTTHSSAGRARGVASAVQRREALGGVADEVSLAHAHPSTPHHTFAACAESDARRRGIRRLVLLTTRTADWFQQRGFAPAGVAHASELLPDERRARVDASRNSQLYSKLL